MTRIWYDTEFIEDGKTIELISIGMVRDDARELYLINGDPAVMARAVNHPWLRENVIPKLPVLTAQHAPGSTCPGGFEWEWEWDNHNPEVRLVRPLWQIAEAVRGFILDTPDPQLRAWYAAYDHVALMQLWGPMIKRPEGIPMWTFDLKQEADRIGNPEIPQQSPAEEHHALADALHDREIDRFLEAEYTRQLELWAR